MPNTIADGRVFTGCSPQMFDEQVFEQYFQNFLIETKELNFAEAELKMADAMMLRRFMRESTRPFFFYHFAPLAVTAVRTLFSKSEHPHILDLGCGTGAMSILFALLGARVTGIDRDA